MNFRRGIISAEWEHKRLKMIIEDLKIQAADIQSVKVLVVHNQSLPPHFFFSNYS